MNPFDFSASKLQASAPEFVPSLAKLSLDETPAATTNGNSTASQETAINEPRPRTLQAEGAAERGGNNHRSNHNYERERDRDSRPGSTRQQRRSDYRDEREDRREREDRYERNDRRRPQKQQRYDNHRSNKRRDDWNRNRDRINGFPRAVDDLDTSNESAQPSPEKQSQQQQISPRRAPPPPAPDNEKLSQREKLIRDIEQRRLECLVCVEAIKAHQPTWSS